MDFPIFSHTWPVSITSGNYLFRWGNMKDSKIEWIGYLMR